MKCSFSKVDCHDCTTNSNCEVYDTLMDVPVLWGEAAKEFEEELTRKPTKKELETMRRVKKIFENTKL